MIADSTGAIAGGANLLPSTLWFSRDFCERLLHQPVEEPFFLALPFLASKESEPDCHFEES
jgi:hypothetical protein